MSGADKLPEAVALQWQAVFQVSVIESWGMTETCASFFTNTPDDNEIGTVGRLLADVQARIIGADGNDVADGDVGELHVASKDLFLGYWGEPEKTRAALGSGWFKTGDQFKHDASGRYRFIGRIGNMIKYDGVFVSPYEIEDRLRQHPAVADCVAIGVPSEEHGQEVDAFIVPRGPVSLAELREHAARMLGAASRPSRYWVVPALLQSGLGKTVRSRDAYVGATLMMEHPKQKIS
jgi:acyl-CoA synthetase (AMP-forming)/AMP-acid ligase II